MMPFKFTPSDRRRVIRIDTSGMIAEYKARGGAVRQFEPGTTASYDHIKSYLLDHGYQLSMVRNMNCVKKIGAKGKGKAMHWTRIIALVDELRLADGKQPFRRAA